MGDLKITPVDRNKIHNFKLHPDLISFRTRAWLTGIAEAVIHDKPMAVVRSRRCQ
jgi:hypothetical protein